MPFIGRPDHLSWRCGVQGRGCLHHWQGLCPQVQDQQQEDVLLDAGVFIESLILAILTFCYAGAKGWQGWGVVQEGMHCIVEMRNFFYVLINLKRGDHLHLRIHEYVAGKRELEQPSSTWKRSCWWRFRRWLAWRVTSRFSISLLSPFTAPPLLQFGGVGY